MKRRSFFLGVGIVALLLVAVGGGLALLVGHEPTGYQQAAVPEGESRQKQSGEFHGEFVQLIDGIVNKRQWYAKFTEDQINSFFEEDFVKSGTADKALPECVREPRVTIQPDRIRLAFRYGSEQYSTVLTIDLRAWLAPKEPNVVALEIQGLWAGSLPISSHTLLQRVSEAADQQNLKVTWYRHEGKPVALLRFQPYQSRPSFQLQRLELGEGTLLISGRSLDATPVASLTPSLPAAE
jgi:hypothetical protein